VLVLYFVYEQNDTIPVDSNVIKCATALKCVPPFCKSGDVILQQFVPPHFWPHANMVLALYGQLLSTTNMAFKIREIAKRNNIMEINCCHCLIPCVSLSTQYCMLSAFTKVHIVEAFHPGMC